MNKSEWQWENGIQFWAFEQVGFELRIKNGETINKSQMSDDFTSYIAMIK